MDVVIAEGAGATAATYDSNTNTITVNVDNSISGGDTTTNIAAAIAGINGGGVFTATATGGSAQYVNTDDSTYSAVTTGGNDGATSAAFASGTLTVNVGLGATNTQVAAAIAAVAATQNTSAMAAGLLSRGPGEEWILM